jgi:flavodoxin I
MPKIGLFYGSSTGNTEMAAFQLKEQIDALPNWDCEVTNIGEGTPEKILSYQYLIFGIPTWNTGELQDDWDVFFPRLREMDFNGKKVALFGMGDQNGYGFNFLDAIGMLADEVLLQGGELFGLWPSAKYEFEESKAKIEDHFLGLGLDQDGQAELTVPRIKEWVQQVIGEFEGKWG